MRFPALLAVLGLTLTVPLLAADPAAKGTAKLEGTWSVVSAEHNGTKIPADQAKAVKFVITADKFKIDHNGDKHEADYKLDATKKPATIDVTPQDGPDKGKTAYGIYALNGGELKICFAKPGSDRPTEFASKADSETTLIVLKREKP